MEKKSIASAEDVHYSFFGEPTFSISLSLQVLLGSRDVSLCAGLEDSCAHWKATLQGHRVDLDSFKSIQWCSQWYSISVGKMFQISKHRIHIQRKHGWCMAGCTPTPPTENLEYIFFFFNIHHVNKLNILHKQFHLGCILWQCQVYISTKIWEPKSQFWISVTKFLLCINLFTTDKLSNSWS